MILYKKNALFVCYIYIYMLID